MYDLPPQFSDLSPKRQDSLARLAYYERLDSALNAVVICLKCLNHVHHFGVKRLSRLVTRWGTEIDSFYRSGNMFHERYQDYGSCGDLTTDPLKVFFDLSPRRMREITSFLAQNRQEAHGNAIAIGIDLIRKELGFGELRTDRLLSQWFADMREFYNDRETAEPLLKQWLADIGFDFENGMLHVYTNKNGNFIKKQTAEKSHSPQDD